MCRLPAAPHSLDAPPMQPGILHACPHATLIMIFVLPYAIPGLRRLTESATTIYTGNGIFAQVCGRLEFTAN